MQNFNNKQKIFIITFIVIFILVLVYTIWNLTNSKDSYIDVDEDLMINNSSTNNTIQNNINNGIIEATSEKIVIYIIGSVGTPGIYELNVNSRVSDAVNAAGGLLEDADLSKINLAFKLEDGQKITIPSINDKTNEEVTYEDFITSEPGNIISDSSSNNSNTKININTASQTELESLPGVGPSIAEKIINYRTENGNFKSIDDLKNVSGIGESKYNEIKLKICI